MRTPAEPALWRHVTAWMLSSQVLRGLLIALVLYPFLPAMRTWTYVKRAASIAGLYIGFGQWASTVAGSGTIEGWLILRPEFTAPSIVVKAMMEGLVQGAAFAAWVARAGRRPLIFHATKAAAGESVKLVVPFHAAI